MRQVVGRSPLGGMPSVSRRIGCHGRGDSWSIRRQETVSQHGQTLALPIVQSEPTASRLHLHRAVFFAKAGDPFALLTIDRPTHTNSSICSAIPRRL